MIPEAVVIEGVVPEANVLEGASSGLEVPIAPETAEEVRDDALPESSMDVVAGHRRSKTRNQSVRRRCQRQQRLVVADWSF
jgi:hypothetical protein